MWYGNTWYSNDNTIDKLVAATKALGIVLSTPVGVVMLENLELSSWEYKYERKEYDAMVDAGKRPTKKREDARARYERAWGEEWANKDALAYMVVGASNYTVGVRAAKRAIRYELEQIEKVDMFDPMCEKLRKLRRRCENVVYNR